MMNSILIKLVANALPSLKNNIDACAIILFHRINSIIFIYTGANASASANAFYIQSIGSGIGIYSVLFLVTLASNNDILYLLATPVIIHNLEIKENLHNKNGFDEIIYSLHNNITSHEDFSEIIKIFFNYLSKDNKYFLLMKIEFEDGSIKTMHKGIVISKHSQNSYIEFIMNLLSLRSNDYNPGFYSKIIFNFFLIDKDREQYYIDKWSELEIQPKPIKLEKFGKYKLPSNRDYLSWGNITAKTPSLTIISASNGIQYLIFHDRIDVFKNTRKSFSFIDSDFKDDIFIRDINNTKFYIQNENIILKTQTLKTKFLSKLEINKKLNTKIITFDIETLLKGDIQVPYLYSMFDGKKTYSWFTDNPKFLFDQLLKSKYKNYHVYAHNLSNFDLIFIFKYISSLESIYQIDTIKKEDKIIAMTIKNRDKNVCITLKDSLLLLPDSLEKLSKNFNVETPKGIEPVLVGDGVLEHPEYGMSDFSHYKKEILKIDDFNLWKNLVQQYCENDCISLYQILIKFSDLVYKKWKVNIDKYPTTPSLAFAIYRTHYLKKDTIPITVDRIFDFIRESFTGGSTEMYIPSGENIFCYDVNSLYPTMMKNWEFPVGDIMKFEGDITILDKDSIYWIGDVKVSTKKHLFAPYLQIHHKTNGGLRTIAPNGSFSMKINSPEYYNALKDYNISINNGYFFRKEKIFSEFVTNLYSLRQQYSKSDPMNMISKLIMNSLYGRFAMKPINSKNIFTSFEGYKEFSEKYEISDVMDLGDNEFFVTYIDTINSMDSKVSIGISSAVTAYARVFMSKFKNNPEFNLYYTDTDSIFIDKELPDYLVNNELGNFKLEYKFKEAVFLGPKIYAGITIDDKYICKIKGYKDSTIIPFEDMKSLLMRNKYLRLYHNKWFRSLIRSNINIKSQVYNLIATENKRKLIYNEDGLAIVTNPLFIYEE